VTIRLYSYAMSPYASKVHCFLLYKQLDFECFYINPLRVRRDLPLGHRIPVLTVDGESRADSTPIGLWLDLAAYPQLALFYATGFRGGEDVRERPALIEWLARVRPYVSGEPPLLPDSVRTRDLP
jgi:glutathione S-transferase